MVAGGSPGVGRALDAGQIVEFLKHAHRRGTRMASVCSGTLLLAAAGVLDGRRATTHWNAVERLRHLRPQVKVDDESIYVRDGNVWTSAGVTTGIDLALAMIEADLGRATALAVARLYVVFRIRPGGQRQYSSELAAQEIRDDRLSRLAERIARRPEQDWRTLALAIEAGMSNAEARRV
jgi:transcriptional regulator GlxA family with amidase domain